MKKTSLLFLLFTISTLAFSQTEGSEALSIDRKRSNCLSLETNLTTSGMVNCEITARQEWDEELNKYYKLLMSLLDSAGKEKLKIAQRQWIEFRDKEFEMINELYPGQMQGTMWIVIAAGRKTDIVRNRAGQLAGYYDSIEQDE
ncbi:lysozyme inhibitor LprI family protein [Algoriphagus zhangzhouensis]|uniref:Lysozyme inhibitor LprI-like N-terminal domain-containing protein n=1 Tax=Algoriphagus zhangzhouensis TaxID=1073327 RepID=A0A1M7ZD93_9BACT|nr:lysozyme inhibitor LprI family protein [Algoriphagus zhangzhouensis]TDY45701.1 uncharacterized protein DUF1311 [Algoriphagus zhangzhouensis]SHO62769.1 Protein of unknown function [Algoriphagus zhangzhouensis]